MEMTGLLPVLRRWLAVVLIAVAMAATVGWWLSASADETYEAKSVLLVGPLNTDTDTMRASGALAQTYAELATSDSVLDRVGEVVDVPDSTLSNGVRATANSTTRFLTVRARADDAGTAADLANAVGMELIELGRQDALRPEGQLRVIDPATPPARPISPRADLVVPLAALAGLLGSLILVVVFELVTDLVETGSRVTEVAEAPTLTLARPRSWWRRGDPRRADPLEVIATQVELASPEVRSILVTTAGASDGTAHVALDLARLWSERRSDVTVLDATGDRITLWLEPPAPDAPRSEALTEGHARAIIDDLAPDGTKLVVVLARSPVRSAATLVWARAADVTLLGVRRFQTRRSQVRDAAANLRAARANLAFCILHDGTSTTGASASDPRAASGPAAVTAHAAISRSTAATSSRWQATPPWIAPSSDDAPEDRSRAPDRARNGSRPGKARAGGQAGPS